MVFGVVMFLFCFVVCVWFRFFGGGGRTGRNSIHWCVCVWFFFVFGRNVRNAETGCDERETRTDFSIGRSNNNDDDDDNNNINNSSNKKENASLCVCVCCGTRKWFRFSFGCGKVWGKKLPKIPAEPTTSSSGRADAEVDADGPAFMRNAIQNDCFQANTHTRGSSGRRCHGDALPRPSVATRPERRTRTASFECNAF